ncbi:uncharacterized protein LOC127547970 [Antechinus flavipes]|uniref:uncharacterized protein LOC127547970 n=1 Tax=Antechinus flavipes TaxID=38775 RepID=UPI002236644D|nr:uncharacterized protein LOC127547970 [Antechinus flavipes]
MEVMGGQAPAGAGGLAAVNMGPEALILAVAVAGAGGGPSPTTAGSGSSPEADTWTWTWTWKGEWSGQDIALGPTLAALLLLYAALWASVVELRWRVLDLAQQQEEEPDPETGTEERAETRTEAEAGAEAKQVLKRESEQELKHKAEAVPERETEPEAEAEADADEELEELQEPSGAWDSKKPTSLCEIGPRTNVPVRGMSARPVGVAGVVVAVRSGLVLKLTTLDARAGSLLPARSQQVILDQGSIRSLRPLGLDLVHMNHCWNNGRFFPLLGAFQEHLLNLLEQEASRARTNILVLLDTKILKKIYHQVSNAYKMDGDPKMSGLSLQQLLEILLSCKKITTTYIKRNNIAITVEGEDACLFNSNAMYGVNLGLRGLESKEELATNKAIDGDHRDVFQPLSANTKQSRETEESKSERLFGTTSE